MTIDYLGTLRLHIDGYEEEERAEQEWAQGSFKQRERIEVVADLCAATWPGDLVEIGCMNGSTTARLARVARKFGRRVVAVDPWQPGTQDCQGAEYENFLRVTLRYADIVDVVRLPSQHPWAVEHLRARELCFTFIDGLHEYAACLLDIETVGHCHGYIAVDDLNWRDDLPKAFNEGAARLGRETYHNPLFREGYILPRKE